MSNIKLLGLLMLLLTFISCNKEEEPMKAINIEVWGYNVGDAELEMSVDTTIYRSFATQPNSAVTFSKVYTYPFAKKTAVVRIQNKASGKGIYQREVALGTSEMELFFPFVFINGKELKVEPATADPATNKLSFYIHYPKSESALDIFLKNEAGQTLSIAQNVKPGTWINVSYVPKEGFTDKNKNYELFFIKTSTTDGWYFEDSEMKSKAPEASLFFPKNEEKGMVRTYFITPGNQQLDVIRLFKRPKG